jgi:deazaflavin-dependent oxidoreductase (nitroreductase family)
MNTSSGRAVSSAPAAQQQAALQQVTQQQAVRPPGAQLPAAPTLATLQPVPPSLVVKIVMGPMTRVLNPIIVKFAGRRRFHMAAQIRHVGRRSGREYLTPVSARRSGDVVLIALTFGNQSDWSQNVRAAGGCSLRLEGADYRATAPEFLSPAEAAPYLKSAFSPLERAGLRILRIKQLLCLHIEPAASRLT